MGGDIAQRPVPQKLYSPCTVQPHRTSLSRSKCPAQDCRSPRAAEPRKLSKGIENPNVNLLYCFDRFKSYLNTCVLNTQIIQKRISSGQSEATTRLVHSTNIKYSLSQKMESCEQWYL